MSEVRNQCNKEAAMAIYDFHDLEIYEKGFDLAVEIHRITESFPDEEQFSTTEQIRRSTKRICATIAEGFGRSPAQFKRYLREAHGSIQETKVWIEFAEALEFLEADEARRLWRVYDTLGKRTWTLHENWEDLEGSPEGDA